MTAMPIHGRMALGISLCKSEVVEMVKELKECVPDLSSMIMSLDADSGAYRLEAVVEKCADRPMHVIRTDLGICISRKGGESPIDMTKEQAVQVARLILAMCADDEEDEDEEEGEA